MSSSCKEPSISRLTHTPEKMGLWSIISRVILVITLIEIAIMLLFAGIGLELDPISEALLDAILLATLSAPFLYFWVINPFVQARDDAEARMTFMALHDPLTQLPNRRLLEEHLDVVSSRCMREKNYSAVLLIDLDGFKPINDRYGHEVGDLVLQKVANRLCQGLRQTDLAARLGGDEFVVLTPDLGEDPNTAHENARLVASKLKQAIATDIGFHNTALNVDASIGIRLVTPDYADTETLLRDADTAMYAAKQAGRNQVQSFKTQAL